VVPNGVRTDLFKFNDECLMPDKSIYLAKITIRKRQHLAMNVPGVDFIGNNDYSIPRLIPQKAEWDKETLYQNLTNYANLVLLSDGEAHPLVCLEALSAGLGLVLSEYAAANLDKSLPFINIIPESLINNEEFVKYTIKENRKVSILMRKEIREYAEIFSWEKIISERYLPCVLQ
jgi:glycosyltransferase involved in cell wall biosynthesis